MDDSDKSVSLSTPTKFFASQKPLAPDENNESHQEMGPNLQNTNKPTTKNFMAPTISAASKATLPRRKILAESNQAQGWNSAHTHVQKEPILDTKLTTTSPATVSGCSVNSKDRSLSNIKPSLPLVNETDDKDQNSLVEDSSFPYDPMTNYLSPRPKFLRYNPNRFHEIFLRQEKEIKANGSVSGSFSCDSQKDIHEESDLVSSSGSSIGFPQEGEEFDETDDDEIEGQKENCWSLKQVFKFSLVLVVLVLSTLHISSMNSLSPSLGLQAMEGLVNGSLRIKDSTYGNVKNLVGNHLLDDGKGWDICFMEQNCKGIDDGVEERKTFEDVYTEKLENPDDMSEAVELKDEGNGDFCELERVITEGISSQMAENVELQETETLEKFDSLEDHHTPIMSNELDHKNMAFTDPNVFEKETAVEMDPVREIYNEEERRGDQILDSEMVSNDHINFLQDPVQKIHNESEGRADQMVTNDHINFESLNHEVDGSSRKDLIEHTHSAWVLIAFIGVSSLFAAIVAYLAFRFRVRQKKLVKQHSSLFTMPSTKNIADEKYSRDFPPQEDLVFNRVDSFSNPVSLTNTVKEGPEVSYQSRAPTVELLGEFEVGEMSNISVRSCGKKSMNIDSEVSSHSVSIEKVLGSKAYLDSKLASSEFSAISSPSVEDGSFTAKKKFVKREVMVGDGEAKKVETTTPVRRSSRIRNRAIVSP